MPDFCGVDGPDEITCAREPGHDGMHNGVNRHGTGTHTWGGKKLDRKRTTWRCP